MADRWFALLVMTRLLGAVAAVSLLAVHRVTAHDERLIGAVTAYTALSLLALHARPGLRGRQAIWLLDAAVALTLVWWSEDWRSPFYLFALTALVLPVTVLPFRRAVAWGVTFAIAYGVVGVLTARLGTSTLEDTVRLETAATHILVPVLVSLALAYANALLDRLEEQRGRAERLAVEAERQRIAWELHDSAKQRVHAAHLVLSGLPERVDAAPRELIHHALVELRAAAADMDTSVGELRTPLDGRRVDVLVRERANELQHASPARIEVVGALPQLPPTVSAHAYRIVSEALTNAVRHARAAAITVAMDPRDGSVTVTDDGCGLPSVLRVGSHGLRTMRDRAETIGAHLEVHPGRDGGTTVRLVLPANDQGVHA